MFDILSLPFFTNALLVAVITSVITGIVGSYIASRHLVFMSGGISHASFGGLGIAWYFGMNPFFGATIFGVLAAIAIEFLSDKGKAAKDSSIGILWSVGMAIGILFIFLTPGYAPNLMSYLFGNILFVPKNDIILGALLAVCVTILFLVFYRPILYVAYDKEFAATRRMPVRLVNYAMMIVVALSVVMTMKVIGIILAVAMLTLPQAIAAIFCKRLSEIMAVAIVTSAVCSVVGLLISYYFNIPSSATIVFTLGVAYLVIKGIALIIQRSKRRA